MNLDIRQKLESQKVTLSRGGEICSMLSDELWSEESIHSFCEREGIQYVNSPSISYTDLNKNNVLFQELKEKLDMLQKNLSEKLETFHNWDNYNENYRVHFTSQIDNISSNLDKFITASENKTMGFAQWISQIKSIADHINKHINLSIDEFIEQFKYGNKNYVVFGKNGAGKTTLLHKISSNLFKSNSVVIPADRNVKYKDNSHITFHTDYSLNRMLSDTEIALYYLTRKMNSTSLQQYKNDVSTSENINEIFKSVFELLSLERSVEEKDDKLFLYKDSLDNKYSLTTASDGERTVIYIIMASLLSPENSFVFIDEPENHLNGALMRKLFDELERVRSDIRFVYFTHNTDFIESRKNTELIYLEKTDKHLSWKFNKVENYRDLSLDVILNIDGMGRKILFCEGNDRSSIDSKILEGLYDEFEIMPAGSCEQVINNTKGINGKQHIFKREAYGIIDKDYKSENEISSLNIDNIFVLTYNEWENLLLDSEIIIQINSQLFNKNIQDIKSNIMTFINKYKDVVISDYLNKRYVKIISVNKLRYTEDIESQIDIINAENKETILKETSEFVTFFDGYDAIENYDDLMSIVSGKFVVGTLASELGCRHKDDLEDKFISMIKEDSSFRELVKSKINIEFKEIK